MEEEKGSQDISENKAMEEFPLAMGLHSKALAQSMSNTKVLMYLVVFLYAYQ